MNNSFARIAALRLAVAAAAACAVLALFATDIRRALDPARSEREVLRIANWTDYIDPAALEAFTRETGVAIVYDTYDSNEMLETRLLAGAAGYDLVAPTATYLEREIRAGAFQKLDPALLPNRAGLDPAIEAMLARFDPGGAHSMPYMWFTTGLAINLKKARERLGPDVALDSWSILFDPGNAAKLADCGIYVLDSTEDMFAAAAAALGQNSAAGDEASLLRAAGAIARIRPFIKKFHASEYINALANGDICMALGWAGDSLQARNRAEEAGAGVEIGYFIPREGTLLSMDVFAIPKDAPNPAAAHKFLNFLMRPEIAARNSATTNFATPVLAARALMPKAAAQDAATFPPEATMKRLFVVGARDQETQKRMNRLFTDVKLGRFSPQP